MSSDSLFIEDKGAAQAAMRDLQPANPADILGSLFPHGAYPTQIEGFLIGYAGEARGFYRDMWKPSWSRFWAPRNDPNRPHRGIDIFSPVGTRILAVVDGELSCHPADGGKLGNRIWITFSMNNHSYRMIYGHLDSFDMGDGSVLKGAIVGQSGCTGNAGDDPSCMGQNKCGMSSAHVHLQLEQDGVPIDPSAFLNWTLRYNDDERIVDCSEVARAALLA